MTQPAMDLPDFDAYWNYGDPAATDARFLEVLAQADGHASSDYQAQLETQIARTHGLRADFDGAHAWLDRAEARCVAAEARGEDVRVARIRLNLERGRTFNSGGDPARAVPLFEAALAEAEAIGQENYACDAAHMLGIAVPGEGGLEWNLRAITMAEAATDPRAGRWLGSLYNNTGWRLHDLGRYDEALDMFNRSLAFRREQGAGPQVRIARWCVARCLRSMGRYDEALAMQQALLADLDADNAGDGYVHEELGELYLVLDRPAEAEPQFARAYAMLSRLSGLEALDEARLARLKTLGEPRDPTAR